MQTQKQQIGIIKLLLRDDLAPEDEAMLQALYSRNATSAEEHLKEIDAGRREALMAQLEKFVEMRDAIDPDPILDLLIEAAHAGSDRAKNLMARYYVGYNHKSIGDCGTTTLFIENVSLLAAKTIQDNPLYCGQETSTRFMNMAERPLVDPVGTAQSRAVLERWMHFYTMALEPVAEAVRTRHPRLPDEKESLYEGAVQARTFDILRSFLPAGVTTQLSWHTNLRQAGDKLPQLLHHPLVENRTIGAGLHALLAARYPNSAGSIGNPAVSGVAPSEGAQARAAWEAAVAARFSYHTNPGMAFDTTLLPSNLAPYQDLLQSRPRGCRLPHFLDDLGAFTFRHNLDFGSFRDVQRQRHGVCRMPLLTTALGFEPWYLEQLPERLQAPAAALLAAQEAAIDQLTDDVFTRQYYIALGYRVRCQLTYGLPATLYVLELRGAKTVHPTLRRMIHKMGRDFEAFVPTVPVHLDRDPDDWDIRRGAQTITKK